MSVSPSVRLSVRPPINPSVGPPINPSVDPSVPRYFQMRTRRIFCRVSGLIFSKIESNSRLHLHGIKRNIDFLQPKSVLTTHFPWRSGNRFQSNCSSLAIQNTTRFSPASTTATSNTANEKPPTRSYLSRTTKPLWS